MDASLIQAMQAARTAASQRVASSLAPRNVASGPGNNSRAAGALAPMDSASSSTSSSSAADDASTITSSDFLTLLVSELQNQDPTQPVDPNEYITQLVDVNSLEQLISINSGIQSLQPSTTGATGSSVAGSTATSQIARPVAGTDPF